MKKEYQLLQMIRNNPTLYLGKPSLVCLKAFMSGYTVCEYESKEESHPDIFFKFEKFVKDRYKIVSTHSAEAVIDFFEQDEEQAFKRYFELLDEFYQKEQNAESNEEQL